MHGPVDPFPDGERLSQDIHGVIEAILPHQRPPDHRQVGRGPEMVASEMRDRDGESFAVQPFGLGIIGALELRRAKVDEVVADRRVPFAVDAAMNVEDKPVQRVRFIQVARVEVGVGEFVDAARILSRLLAGGGPQAHRVLEHGDGRVVIALFGQDPAECLRRFRHAGMTGRQGCRRDDDSGPGQALGDRILRLVGSERGERHEAGADVRRAVAVQDGALPERVAQERIGAVELPQLLVDAA